MTKELAIRIITGDVLGTSEQTQEAVTMAVKALSMSEVPDNNVGDLISRQAVIKEFSCCDLTPDGGIDVNDAIDFLKQLPSAQPEIIRCKNCIYYRQEIDMCDEPHSTAHNIVHEDDYCSRAERKEG